MKCRATIVGSDIGVSLSVRQRLRAQFWPSGGKPRSTLARQYRPGERAPIRQEPQSIRPEHVRLHNVAPGRDPTTSSAPADTRGAGAISFPLRIIAILRVAFGN